MAGEPHGATDAAVPPRRPGLLITRPAPADEELSAWARAAGFVPIPAPVMRLEPLPAAPPIEAAWDGRPDAVVLTSANAARCAPEAPELRAAPCWLGAVGFSHPSSASPATTWSSVCKTHSPASVKTSCQYRWRKGPDAF